MSQQKIQIFTSADGQAQMAELFDKDVRTINEHLGNIFSEQELEPGASIRKFRILRQEHCRRPRPDLKMFRVTWGQSPWVS